MSLEDKRTRRLVEREITKRSLDNSLLTVMCINQVIYLGGVVKRLRGTMGRGTDVKHEMAKLVEAIESMSGVRDVVSDYRIA